jgi:hypothetical protein
MARPRLLNRGAQNLETESRWIADAIERTLTRPAR